jgi:low affinity Fe/Cu permease
MKEWFHQFASKTSSIAGQPAAFFIALTIVVIWALLGPIFNFSNTWQLFINSTTTIVTVLMVFLIQNTQNRDAKAMHLKVDELIYASKAARDSFIDLEDISDAELNTLDTYFKDIHKLEENKAAHKLHHTVKSERVKRQNKS